MAFTTSARRWPSAPQLNPGWPSPTITASGRRRPAFANSRRLDSRPNPRRLRADFPQPAARAAYDLAETIKSDMWTRALLELSVDLDSIFGEIRDATHDDDVQGWVHTPTVVRSRGVLRWSNLTGGHDLPAGSLSVRLDRSAGRLDRSQMRDRVARLKPGEGSLQIHPEDLGVFEEVAGLKPAREREEEIIVFDSTGVALQDVAAAAAVYRRALADRESRRFSFNT